MKFILSLGVIVFLFASITETRAQKPQLYKDMSRAERLVFVNEQVRRLGRAMSGNDYEITNDFAEDIRKAVTLYAERIGSEKSNLLPVLERAQINAPLLISTFKARNVSPLIGLYIPWIESEYQNIQPADSKAAVGVYQIMPATGLTFGLTPQDLLDVGKSADAAALYIRNTLETFKDDPMKEALSLLAYNRGVGQTSRDLEFMLGDQKTLCSICVLTADHSKLDETFKYESVFYVPRFFAAAIIGENPTVFGIQMQPLSAH